MPQNEAGACLLFRGKSTADLPATHHRKPTCVLFARRAEVIFVDPYQQFISFRSPDRGLRKITLKDSPDPQHYLKELKKGDIVEITYTEAIAVSVDPAS